jgi:hypothetical protein
MKKHTTVFGKCGVFVAVSGYLFAQRLFEGFEELRQLANVDLVVIVIARKAIWRR